MACLTLLSDHQLNAHPLRLVGQQVQKFRMRNVDEFLVVLPPSLNLGLPERLLAQDECSDSFGHQQLNDATACRVQIVHHSTIALRRDPI